MHSKRREPVQTGFEWVLDRKWCRFSGNFHFPRPTKDEYNSRTSVYTYLDRIRYPGIPHHGSGVLRLDCTAFENSYLEPQPVSLLVCYTYQNGGKEDIDLTEDEQDGEFSNDSQIIYGMINDAWKFMLVLWRVQSEEGTYERI